MSAELSPLQHLLTLPPRMAAQFPALEGRNPPEWYASSDPAGTPLGSGGGTANLLVEAWQATGGGDNLGDWLRRSTKLVLHAGGQSRRLPAYALTGKILTPVPVFRWSRGQRLDQTLLDLQVGDYERVARHGGGTFVVMITSGDMLLRFARRLPPFPAVDVLGLGMWMAPEKAKDFGVFFSPRSRPDELAFFLQKPSAARIRELAADHLALVDTGMWLLSERAVQVLLRKCGWDAARAGFAGGRTATYELYAQFGLALGRAASVPDPDIGALTSAVLPLPQAEFYHFGTNEQMIESVCELHNLVLDESRLGMAGARQHPDQINQNSRFGVALRREQNHTFWIENSVVPATWRMASEHVFTGVPDNDWDLTLPAGVCLDFVPVGESDFAVRVYGFRDRFSDRLGDADTLWLGRPARDWFAARGLALPDCQLDPTADIQRCALFVRLPEAELEPRFLEWLFAAQPENNEQFAPRWRALPRYSAAALGEQVNLDRLYAQRARLRRECVLPMMRNFRWSVFHRLDLDSTAREFAAGGGALPPLEFEPHDDPMGLVHDEMFRAAVERRRALPDWTAHEARAFACLRETIVREAQLSPAAPHCDVLEDQIVWARSPVRLDLAGGWTDTPPYCLEHGGQVLNVAVDLNGQPPIQVFARLAVKPEIVLRSIDLGVEERIRSFAELDTFSRPDSPFALAKAAFALAGFLPRFHAGAPANSLADQLQRFGGGIELSLLSAVPKGSGLGTSSILAATVLAALSDLCGLGWDRTVLFTRTLALEQLLTTGGGWQDQAGGIFRGVKLIETVPGLAQQPGVRWLPGHLLERDYANRRVLLYYTGITRLAKNILAEIVRGIFLNSPSHLGIIADIGANAEHAATALQHCDYGLLLDAIRRSWDLNQRLDSGTNPPAVQAILDRVKDDLAAAKLLGAGGGGYLLMFARDDAAGARLRETLTANPPNPRARFVDFQVSETGLQVTRS
jgi:galactokinase/mevalonate kinase-like predicted kinase